MTAATYRMHNTLQPPYFPVAELQEHTNTYLWKIGSTPYGQDAHLASLVRDHSVRGVAIVACAHALSSVAIRQNLCAELQFNTTNELSILSYLKALVGVRHANPSAISDIEKERAQILIFLSHFNVLGVMEQLWQYSEQINELLTLTDTANLVPPRIVYSILEVTCDSLSAQLKDLISRHQWGCAYQATSSLSRILGAAPATEQLLDSFFSNWRMWAVWRPDIRRLNAWEQLKPKERQELADILELEGPDVISSQNATLREALVPQGDPQRGFLICHGQVLLKLNSGSIEEAHRALDRLVSAIYRTCLNSLIAIPLFVHLCLQKPIDDKILTILENAHTIRDHMLCRAVLDMLTGEETGVQMGGILDLLPILNSTHAHPLRYVLHESIGEVSDTIISKLLDRFLHELQLQKNIKGSGMTLHIFMKALQTAFWIRPSLSERTRLLTQQWPSDKDIEYLFMIRAEATNQPSLAELIDNYCITYLAKIGDVDEVTKNTVDGLITIWKQPLHRGRREVSLAIANCSVLDPMAKRQCLALLTTAKTQFVNEIRPILHNGDMDDACTEFVRIFKIPNLLDIEETRCWKSLLLGMIMQRESTLLRYTFKKYPTLDPWLQWMASIQEIFEDLMEIFEDLMGGSAKLPQVLRPGLHRWISHLRRGYLPILLELEEQCMFQSAMPFILTKWEVSTITMFLDLIVPSKIEHYRAGIQAILALVNLSDKNFEETLQALSLFLQMTPPEACILADILKAPENGNKELSKALLNVWFRDHERDPCDKLAIEAIAGLLEFQIPAQVVPSQAAMQAFSARLRNETKRLMRDATSLDSIRITLKEDDPKETSLFLQRLGIDDVPTLGDATSIVPQSLVDVVEQISSGIFEFFFPLNHLKHLQRKALGIDKARMLLVRVTLKDSSSPGFCVHLHPEGNGGHDLNTSTFKHKYFQVNHRGTIPDRQKCRGRDGRIVYQLNRILWRHFRTGFTSLEKTHEVLRAAIDNLTSLCVVCGNALEARLWRSTTCGDTCEFELRKSNIEVHLVDIRHDPHVVDLLLNAAWSAADAGDLELLPGCPFQTTAGVTRILTNTPALSGRVLRRDIDGIPDVSNLLSWICNGYRGFVSSATDTLKIPSMPGIHQFVLANANPKIEKAFTAHLSPSATTRVVFHGTSIDRLYRILLYGLQSGMKKWQRHGASYGQGIYLADEPSRALGYASVSRSTWPASKLPTCNVVLGCELVGTNAPVTQGIYVASDPSTVMVRYVFLFPHGASAPVARHIEPAMASVFASLRNRSI